MPNIWIFLLASTILVACARAQECSTPDSTCAVLEASPAAGDALIQRLALHAKHERSSHPQHEATPTSNIVEALPASESTSASRRFAEPEQQTREESSSKTDPLAVDTPADLESTAGERSNYPAPEESSAGQHAHAVKKPRPLESIAGWPSVHHTDTHQSHPERFLSMAHMTVGGDGLPTGAAELFNKEFCESHQSREEEGEEEAPPRSKASSGTSSRHQGRQVLENRRSQKVDSEDEENEHKKEDSTQKRSSPSEKAEPEGDEDEERGPEGKKSESHDTREKPSSPHSPGENKEEPLSTLQTPSKKPSSKKNDDDAHLDETGFQEVLALGEAGEMKSFVRRVVESCNLVTIDDGGVNGIVSFLLETVDKVSFKKLKETMFKALLAKSSEHWVTVKSVAGFSAATAPLNVVGFVKVRAMRKPKEMIRFMARMIDGMGVKITDKAGYEGLMHFYSEPDDSESFQKLMMEIKKATYEHSWAELK